jgi:UDP-glucose 4-epimerase
MTGHEIVVHLAAFGSVVDSVSAPEVNFEHNVFGTFNVLRAAKEAAVNKVIMASTGGALIGEAEPPVDEQSLPKPISPYGASKLCGEAYCHAFAKAYGLNTVALRFANVYGPYSAHKKGAVTAFIKAIMRGEPMVIYGDGSATRDFLYVDDLCDGICQAIEAELPPGEVLHLASGVETSVLDLAKRVAAAAGAPDHPIKFKPPRPAEVSRNFARYDRARKKLGFEPQWSLRKGLEETWRWFLDNRERVLAAEVTDS